ncbi:MAG TPA: di-heme oxidoredictase family protein [Thermoanaerobaculia bacterium]|nr:di-heme oxidoredictase family protein [Thermoanaerobaculia bacterium]
MVVAVALLSALSLDAQRRRRPSGSPGEPQPQQNFALGSTLPGLTAEQTERFNAGRREFADVKTPETGLGPVYNEQSCGRCHYAPTAGGTGSRTVTHVAAIVDGFYSDLLERGGGLLQTAGIRQLPGSTHDFIGERVPKEATITARRRAQPVYGLGLVEATDDSTFIALAAAQAARGDGIAGRAALVHNILNGMKTVGKFGWKAQHATLKERSADAYLQEIGITNPLFPNELCPSGDCSQLQFNPRPGLNDGGSIADWVADYIRFLGPPQRGPITPDVTAGATVFARIGCDVCHTPTLQTAPNAIAALDRVTYHPYSDFLLHDMGSLGDGIEQGAAKGTEMRTPPLWGMHHFTTFLHDGRAKGAEAAILAHDGQGRGARDRFAALDAADKARVLAFLKSL